MIGEKLFEVEPLNHEIGAGAGLGSGGRSVELKTLEFGQVKELDSRVVAFQKMR